MGYIISVAFITIVAIVSLIAAGKIKFTERKINRQTGERVVVTHGSPGWVTPTIIGIWLFLLGFGTFLSSYRQVDAGHVGVVRTFGEITGQIEEGPNFILPWQTSRTQDIRVQKSFFRNPVSEDDEDSLGRIEAASIDTQDVFLNITLNWSVSGNAVQQLHRTVGPNFFSVLVPTRVLQHSKAEVVKHTAVEVTQKREEIRQNIAAALRADLANFSIDVVSLQIDNISYQPEFSAAIESKQVATQEALRQQELVAAAEAEARQKIASERGTAEQTVIKAEAEAQRKRIDAQGDADAIRLRAEAQAEANREIAASLTEPLIQYEALAQLDGVSLALIPADSTTILDPTGILRSGTP